MTLKKSKTHSEMQMSVYDLNSMLAKYGVEARVRSQFIGTCFLYVKKIMNDYLLKGDVNKGKIEFLNDYLLHLNLEEMYEDIGSVIRNILKTNDDSPEFRSLYVDVFKDKSIKDLTKNDLVDILDFILKEIYVFVESDFSCWSDFLALLLVTFNKNLGKDNKSQVITPDYISDFMSKAINISSEDIVLDECCGSGSLLVQSLKNKMENNVLNSDNDGGTFGIETNTGLYGLALTNMLIYGDDDNAIELGSCFDNYGFIKSVHPTACVLNPPYNASARSIPEYVDMNGVRNEYRRVLGSKSGNSEDPTKGMVFVKYLSDIAKANNWNGTRLAVLLPFACAMGKGKAMASVRRSLLKDSTLDAVFSLSPEIFNPTASVQTCCMIFELNKSHYEDDGVTPRKETFFGYCKDDGFGNRKNFGRIEKFNKDGESLWEQAENKWLDLYRSRSSVDGLSAVHAVTENDEWLCEAYMKTDYSKLSESDFQQTVNDYFAYLIKNGKAVDFA